MNMQFDYRDELREYYTASEQEPKLVEVPSMNFLQIDGEGDPNKGGFSEAASVLYGIAYKTRFILKKSRGDDFRMPPLEGLWWMKDETPFDANRRDDWCWRLLLMQPSIISEEESIAGRDAWMHAKKILTVPPVKFVALEEGRAVQILHIGPYDNEGDSLQKLYGFISEQELTQRDRHHEIYFNDPRRIEPEKLKTILRQPVE